MNNINMEGDKVGKFDKIKQLFEDMENDHIGEYTAQCAYYLILSFIPFIMLLLTLIQYTSIEKDTLFLVISNVIPSSMNELIIGIIEEVYSKSFGTISITAIVALWSAGRGLYALIKGLNAVYEKEDITYIYLKFKSVINTVIFLLVIVIALILLVFGKTILSILQERFNLLNNISNLSVILTDILLLIITFLVFLSIYKFMPKHKVTFRSQIPGAIFSAFGLNLISFVFSRYLDIFRGFSIMYGSLTTIVLVMMWIYACIYTLFIGAEINKNLTKIKEEKKILNGLYKKI